MTIDEDRLNELLGRFVGDLGGAFHAVNAVIGDRLGLYRALWETMPATPAEVAARSESGCTLAITGQSRRGDRRRGRARRACHGNQRSCGPWVPPRAGASVDNAMHGG